MNFVVIPGKKKLYIGLAKKEAFTSKTPDPILEPGELWFEFGKTPEEALEKIVNCWARGEME